MTAEAGWYPVALSTDLRPGTSAGTRLFGAEIVIWRDTAGMAHAWEDRCPHRGMRLSFGFVRGDRLACLYHGWQYDGAGRCRLIPAHPRLEVPETIAATAYPASEGFQLIWVGVGAPAGSPEWPAEAGELLPLRSLYLDRPVAAVRDHLLAMGGRPTAGEMLSVEAEGTPVFVAMQPIAAARAALHLLVAGRAADRGALAFWAEALRRDIEAGASGSA